MNDIEKPKKLTSNKNTKFLTRLVIQDNEKLISLLESSGQLQALTDLTISNNTSLTHLPDSFGQLKSLTKFRK